jgi:anti-sigma factor RsiW
MNVQETDLQLLEEHLDGELSPADTAQLRQRLIDDPALSAVLKQLQSQRSLRQAAYRSMEPSEITAQQLQWRVRGAMLGQRQQTAQITAENATGQTSQKTSQSISARSSRWGQWQIARFGSAAAACLVLGFFAGRVGRGNGGAATPSVPAPASPVGIVATGNQNLTPEDNSSRFVPVSTAPRISVPITNEYGQVVAWQTFDNPEQAKSFTEDLVHTHAQQSSSGSQTKLVDSPQPF